MMRPAFAMAEIGDVVILNSGGPKMTVVETSETQVRVVWTSDDDKLEGAWLPRLCVFVHRAAAAG